MEIIPAGKRVRHSWRILVYGGPGIGKTTLSSFSPQPLIFDLEDGAEHVNAPRTPVLQTYDEVLKSLRWFYGQKEYTTAVIDSLDVLEVKIHEHLCKVNRWESIESPGYGKGYAFAQEEWMRLIGAFDMCVQAGKNILCLGHEQIRAHNAPDSDAYDRYGIKLNQKSANLIVARMDAVLFAQIETIMVKDKGKDNRRYAQGTGDRVLRCLETPAWIAKNRFGLPETVPMDGTLFEKINSGRV